MTWQSARVLPQTERKAVPAGTELWVEGRPEAMTAERRRLAGNGRWSPPPADRLIRTHLVLPTGEPLYIRVSLVELLADFRESVEPVCLLDVPGADLAGVWIGRDPR